jgi:hypothetical protein
MHLGGMVYRRKRKTGSQQPGLSIRPPFPKGGRGKLSSEPTVSRQQAHECKLMKGKSCNASAPPKGEGRAPLKGSGTHYPRGFRKREAVA